MEESVSPHPELVAAAPSGFKLHTLAAFAPSALGPFTRLVHVFSAPLGYLTRRYVVCRSRDDQFGSRAPRRGWEKVTDRFARRRRPPMQPDNSHPDQAWTKQIRQASGPRSR